MKKALFLLIGAVLLFGFQPGDRLDDETMRALGIRDKGVYVIDFFASWCHSCEKELPLLNTLKNARIIGVDVDENVEDGRRFVKELGLGFDVIEDPEGAIVSRFDPAGIPAIYIIKDGKVAGTIIGARPDIDRAIASALERLR